MALNAAGLTLAADGFKAGATHMSLHSADPGATGTNATTAARQAVTMTVDGNGDLSVPQTAFTGGAASGAVTHVGFWSALTGGTFYGSFAIGSGDTAFNAAGAYTVNAFIINLT